MHHIQTRPARAQTQCGKPDASNMYMSNSVEDDTQYIRAVTLHPHQFDGLQKNGKSKGSLLRNNYGNQAIRHELSAALQPTGAQSKQSSQVHAPGPEENSYSEKDINGQWPQLSLIHI